MSIRDNVVENPLTGIKSERTYPAYKPNAPWGRDRSIDASQKQNEVNRTAAEKGYKDLRSKGFLEALFHGHVQKSPGSREKSPTRQYHDGGPGRVESAGRPHPQSIRRLSGRAPRCECLSCTARAVRSRLWQPKRSQRLAK